MKPIINLVSIQSGLIESDVIFLVLGYFKESDDGTLEPIENLERSLKDQIPNYLFRNSPQLLSYLHSSFKRPSGQVDTDTLSDTPTHALILQYYD